MNIYDIAKLAGVSIATVSRVVNDSPMVSEKTKEKVRKIMWENNYTPNIFARGLGLNSMKTIGIVCPDVSDTYMANAVAFLELNLKEYGYDCMLYCSGYNHEDMQIAVNSMLQKRIDALVMVGSIYSQSFESPHDTDYIKQAAKEIPVFLMNAYVEDKNIYCALCDDFEASYIAVKQLIKSGRKKILYLSDSNSFSANRKRMGYETAIKESNMKLYEEFIVLNSNKIFETRDILLLKQDVNFDAVFATDDTLAVGVIKYAKERKLKIPHDISIIGYNNFELSVACEPELSTVDNRLERLCKIIIDSMMLLFKKKSISNKVYVKGHLIKRATTDF